MMKEVSSTYIHFPFCLNRCNYCDFFCHSGKGTLDASLVKRYESGLRVAQQKQLDLLDQYGFITDNSRLDTVYLGGGTPALWSEHGPGFLVDFLQLDKLTDKIGEFTLELNPGAFNRENLNKWKAIGVNRFSVGAQSFDNRFLTLLDRDHNCKDLIEVLELLQEENFSVDLMLGLPGSVINGRDIIRELTELLRFAPKHFSVYILTPKKNYIHKERLPSEDFIEQEYLEVSNFLKSNGYDHYEVSNFAKPGYRSKHNMKYWTGDSVLSYGPSATGYLNIEENSAVRYKWNSRGSEFSLETLNKEEIELERLYLGLRTDVGISLENRTENFREVVHKWCDRSLATAELGRVKLTAKGYLIMDYLIEELFNKSVMTIE